ncbi:MAG: hypothetical protein PSX36_07900 [bacterium]|nr:hypothetical protein [bacterium]
MLVLLALWVATPKVYIHILLKHNHTSSPPNEETKVKSESNDDCDFEKYDKPAYFNIFKFISSFIPNKQPHSGKISGTRSFLSIVSVAISPLRGPPVSE